MVETWQRIEGFYYDVSTNGRVMNVITSKILSQEVHDGGYKTVRLYKNGRPYKKYVHRLVAQAFLSNPFDKPNVNHIDNNKHNNNVRNLEWVTQKENVRHSIDNGNKRGLRSDLVLKIYLDIHFNCMKIKDVANKYKVSERNVISIRDKKSHQDILSGIEVVKKIELY
ncbi:HNH endonuclease [Bacillus toyonensis]|uniref:HNH endonuclease n=1 Tax=Bacillus toyonensis TaxID=155322 RepID=UPI00027BEAC0|nr:HNH endonuclease [Bacillus toyonensis]EJV41800.1 hypothetical protein IEA_05685 [Bacillus toyonensis]